MSYRPGRSHVGGGGPGRGPSNRGGPSRGTPIRGGPNRRTPTRGTPDGNIGGLNAGRGGNQPRSTREDSGIGSRGTHSQGDSYGGNQSGQPGGTHRGGNPPGQTPNSNNRPNISSNQAPFRGGAPNTNPRAQDQASKTPRGSAPTSLTEEERDKLREERQRENERLARLLEKMTFPARPLVTREDSEADASFTLRTNHFRIIANNINWCRYNVTIILCEKRRNETNPARRRRILSMLLERLRPITAATDYSEILITKDPLNDDLHQEVWRIKKKDWFDRRVSDDGHEVQYEVTLELKARINPQNILDEVKSSDGKVQACFSDPRGILQAINIVASNVGNLDAKVGCVGRHKLFPFQGQHSHTAKLYSYAWCDLLRIFRGYFVSARVSDNDILLNVNTTASVFYQDINLGTILNKTYLERNLGTLQRLLRGRRVQTIHRPGGFVTLAHDPIPTRSVTRVEFIRAGDPETYFTWTRNDSERSGTVADYFAEEYSNSPVDTGDLLLEIAPRKGQLGKVYVPVKYCQLVPVQYRGKLEPKDRDNMVRFSAKQDPKVSAEILKTKAIPFLGIGGQDSGLFGQLVDPPLVKVVARKLPDPSIAYSSGKVLDVTLASWNLARVQFVEGAKLPKWAILALDYPARFDPTISDQQVKSFKKALVKAMGSYGLSSSDVDVEPATKRLSGYPDDVDIAGVDEYIGSFGGKFLVVILTKKNALLYSHIKRLAELKHGIQTACFTPKKKQLTPQERNRGLSKDDMPWELCEEEGYLANLLLKINLKLGGRNHKLISPKFGFWDDDTMIVGIDVAHPTGSSNKKDAPSIAAVVASYSSDCVQWPAEIAAQTGRKEMVSDLRHMIARRLKYWKSKHNKTLPKRIVVYRDGVSEGQFGAVIEEELPQIQDAYRDQAKGKGGQDDSQSEPKFEAITIIICTKRHHTRFYPESPGETKNPLAGTVVDRDITLSKMWDFYLQSHHSPLGTAKNTKYTVIHNGHGESLTNEGVQKMTYDLCWMYGKATKALSICPPAHYADLACERGLKYLHKTFNSDNQPEDEDEPRCMRGAEWDWTTTAMAPVHRSLSESMFYL